MCVEKVRESHHKPVSWPISISLLPNFNTAQKFCNWASQGSKDQKRSIINYYGTWVSASSIQECAVLFKRQLRIHHWRNCFFLINIFFAIRIYEVVIWMSKDVLKAPSAYCKRGAGWRHPFQMNWRKISPRSKGHFMTLLSSVNSYTTLRTKQTIT